jgi:WD repeat-containing protein 45
VYDFNPIIIVIDFNAGVGAVQMLGKANFIALIGGGKQPKFPQNKVSDGGPWHLAIHTNGVQVIIWDDAKQKVALQIPVLTTVRGVKLSRTHIVVALQNSVRVYKFLSPPELWSVFETADNPLGLCCLTPKTLAFPGRTPGQVQMVELSTGNVSIIPAHGSALRAIDISLDGEVLATASETVSKISTRIVTILIQTRVLLCGYLPPVIVLESQSSDVG